MGGIYTQAALKFTGAAPKRELTEALAGLGIGEQRLRFKGDPKRAPAVGPATRSRATRYCGSTCGSTAISFDHVLPPIDPGGGSPRGR